MRHSPTRRPLRLSFARLQRLALVYGILVGLLAPAAGAVELKPETAAAFDRYIAATEARMNQDTALGQFLVIDRLPEAQRKEAYDQLQGGQPYIEELHTEADGRPIRIPGGLIHHWVGIMFIPKGTLSEVNAVLQDVENEPSIYKPEIRKARLIERSGTESKIYLQFYSKSVITVVLNAYFDVGETQLGSSWAQSVSHSTRIAEVADAGTPNEHERADGADHGYMWRMCSYWRIEEKDGGVYIQNESITLTRTVPAMLAWLINPLTKSIPREVLLDMLNDTQKAVVKTQGGSQTQR